MDLFKDQAGLFGCFSCSSVLLSFVFFGLTPTTESRRPMAVMLMHMGRGSHQAQIVLRPLL